MTGVALIGLGMVAETYLRCFQDLAPDIHLTGVLAGSAQSSAAFAARHADTYGALATYADISAVAADGAVDFAIIATPPNARTELVDILARAGKPVLMEKPVERNLAAAQAVCQICQDNDIPLGIVLQHRMRPAARHLHKMMAQSVLGALLMVDVRIPWWRDQGYYDDPGRGTYERDGGGVMISQAIHTLDLMLSFTGPVNDVTAMVTTTGAHQMEAENFVAAGLRFSNGAAGSVMATTSQYPGFRESIVLVFEKATATLVSNELVLDWRDGRQEVIGASIATGAGADPMAFTHDWHRDIIADFADALANARPPVVTGRDALQVHALIEAIEASGRNGTKEVLA